MSISPRNAQLSNSKATLARLHAIDRTRRSKNRNAGNQFEGSLVRRLQAPAPFPNSKLVFLKYTGLHILFSDSIPVSNAFGIEQVYRLNSLYDPDLTNAGHQPYGYDTLCEFYRQYQVLGCFVEIQFRNPGANDVYGAFSVQTGQNTNSLTGANAGAVAERNNCIYKHIPLYTNGFVWKEYFPIHVIEGLPLRAFLGNVNYTALVGANPTFQSYLRIAISASGTTLRSSDVIVNLTFKARMFDITNVGQS